MARFVRAPLSLAAAVRAHFGLTQAELAGFIGVSRANLAHVEAGRKALGPGPDQRLQVLARQLPPPDGLGPPAPAFAEAAATASAASGAGPADPDALAPLRRRLARCRWLRTRLAHELAERQQPGQARHLRRLWAVRVLGPALAAPLPVPGWLAPAGYDPGGPALPLPPYPLATPDAARDTYWLSGLALRLAATTPPLPPAAAALARARLAGLDAEIQELTAAMVEVSAPPA
jgi:transcriptional regulator with XRE-family HTH domain